jgi:hypothetical protein
VADRDLLEILDAPETAVLADGSEIEARHAERLGADLGVPAVEAPEIKIGRAVGQSYDRRCRGARRPELLPGSWDHDGRRRPLLQPQPRHGDRRRPFTLHSVGSRIAQPAAFSENEAVPIAAGLSAFAQRRIEATEMSCLGCFSQFYFD